MMEKSNLKSDDFVEYSNWLTNAHRSPLKIRHRSNRIVKNQQVEVKAQKPTSESPQINKGDPVVQFEEDEGIVKKLEITCTCGEKMLLSLDYDEDTNQSNA